MTRKHFNEIADILSAARSTMSDDAHRALVEKFTDLCAHSNPNFNATRFRLACSEVPTMTRAKAEELAKHAGNYVARKVNGRWVVWCTASDHEVTF